MTQSENFRWPLRGPRQKTWNAATVFQARRPWDPKYKQTRLHAGMDLHASYLDDVIAPEDSEIVAVDRGWDGTAKATLVHTASGRSLLLGCTEPGTSPPVGTKVPRGGVLAKIGRYTRVQDGKTIHSSMLHLQVYDARITPAEANKWQSWPLGEPRPPHLVDPRDYLALADEPAAPAPAPVPGQPTEDEPCPYVNGLQVCQASQVSFWEARLSGDLNATYAAFLPWDKLPAGQRPEDVRRGVELYNGASAVLAQAPRSGDDNARVRQLLAGLGDSRRARALFEGRPGAGSGGSGAGAAIAVGGVVVAVGTAAVLLTKKKRRR